MNRERDEAGDEVGSRSTNESRPTVLVVDDEEAILFAIEDFLTARGWRVATAADPERATALLAQGAYCAAIVDLRLTNAHGDRCGLDIVRCIRERSPATRVVLLTAYGSAEVEAEARQLGVASLLPKPQPLPRLDAHLRELIVAEN